MSNLYSQRDAPHISFLRCGMPRTRAFLPIEPEKLTV